MGVTVKMQIAGVVAFPLPKRVVTKHYLPSLATMVRIMSTLAQGGFVQISSPAW